MENIFDYRKKHAHLWESKTNHKQEVDIYYKGIGVLEVSKVF